MLAISRTNGQVALYRLSTHKVSSNIGTSCGTASALMMEAGNRWCHRRQLLEVGNYWTALMVLQLADRAIVCMQKTFLISSVVSLNPFPFSLPLLQTNASSVN